MLQKKEKKDTTANSKTQHELKSEQVGPYWTWQACWWLLSIFCGLSDWHVLYPITNEHVMFNKEVIFLFLVHVDVFLNTLSCCCIFWFVCSLLMCFTLRGHCPTIMLVEKSQSLDQYQWRRTLTNASTHLHEPTWQLHMLVKDRCFICGTYI